MTIRTTASMTDIHEYARQQLAQLEHESLKGRKLTYKEKEYNAHVEGQKRAWEHVLYVEWINPNDAAIEIGKRILGAIGLEPLGYADGVYGIQKENDNAE